MIEFVSLQKKIGLSIFYRIKFYQMNLSILNLFRDKSFLKFIIVGVINTIIGLTIMFACYNLLHLGYWISSALDYIIASIISYFLNKHFTFKYKEDNGHSFLRFVLNIAVCYFVAFSIARPVVRWCLQVFSFAFDKSLLENIAMLIGSGIFTIINYLGQRFFAFKKNNTSSKDDK